MFKSVFFAALFALGSTSVAAAEVADSSLVEEINLEVNQSISYKIDRAGRDIWKLNPSIGDCEDYAITKRQKLIEAGWDPEDLRVVLVYKETDEEKIFAGHVFLHIVSTDQVLDMPSPGRYGRTEIYTFNKYLRDNGWTFLCSVRDIGEGERRYVSDRC